MENHKTNFGQIKKLSKTETDETRKWHVLTLFSCNWDYVDMIR